MRPLRLFCCLSAVLVGVLLIVLLNVLSFPDSWAPFLKCTIDRDIIGQEQTHWFDSVQPYMWVFFFWGVGELITRLIINFQDRAELRLGLLPDDTPGSESCAVMELDAMPDLHRRVRRIGHGGPLSSMIEMVANQFQSTRSVGICNEVLDSICDLRANRIYAAYGIVRYIAWLLPSLGFIGTVYGILNALRVASTGSLADKETMGAMIANLSVAFYTTLLSLLMCCVLMFLLHLIQGREERTANEFAAYCMRNFINRLYVRSH